MLVVAWASLFVLKGFARIYDFKDLMTPRLCTFCCDINRQVYHFCHSEAGNLYNVNWKLRHSNLAVSNNLGLKTKFSEKGQNSAKIAF